MPNELKGVYPESEIKSLDDYSKFIDWFWFRSGRVDGEKLIKTEDSLLLNIQSAFIIRGFSKGLSLDFQVYGNFIEISSVESNSTFKSFDKYQNIMSGFDVDYKDSLRNTKINEELLVKELLSEAEKRLASTPIYNNIYKKVRKHFSNNPKMTLGIWYNKNLKSFMMEINRSFLTYFVASYMLNGTRDIVYNQISGSAKQKVVEAVVYILRHEIGHILAMHSTKRSDGDSKDFTHTENNIWQDCIINYGLTKYISHNNQVSPELIPADGQGRVLTLYGEIKGSSLMELKKSSVSVNGVEFKISKRKKTSRSGYRRVKITDPQVEEFFDGVDKKKIYKYIIYINPSYIQYSRGGTTTSQILSVYKFFKHFFKASMLDTVKKSEVPKVKKDEPKSKEKLEDINIRVGDIVKSKSTGEWGRVKSVDSVTKRVETDLISEDGIDRIKEKLGIKE